MKNVILAMVVLVAFVFPVFAEVLEPLGHACDEAWIRGVKSRGTVIDDSSVDGGVRNIVVRTKVHDRPATIDYTCQGDVVIRQNILFKHENERDAQDTFETERRSLTDAIGKPCWDTTRPSSPLKRVANKLGLDPGIHVHWQAGDHAVHLGLDPVGPGPDYWLVGLINSIEKDPVACDPPE